MKICFSRLSSAATFSADVRVRRRRWGVEEEAMAAEGVVVEDRVALEREIGLGLGLAVEKKI